MYKVAIYARVSTADQDCARQLVELDGLAERRGFHVVARVTDTISGTKMSNGAVAPSRRKGIRHKGSANRDQVMALARNRQIDAILITELSRFGRSVPDLLDCLDKLSGWGVSLLTSTGLEFDMRSATGKLLGTLLAAFAAFERDLIADRTKSALAALQRRGVRLGRQKGQCPSDKHRSAVEALAAQGISDNAIAKRLDIDRRTVKQIRLRHSCLSQNS